MYEFLKVFSLHRNVPEFLYCGEASYGIGPFKCNDYSAYPSVQRLAQVAAALELPMQYLAANGTLHFPAALGSTDFSPHPDHKAVSEVALRLIADGNASQGLMWYAPLLLDPCGVAPLIQARTRGEAEVSVAQAGCAVRLHGILPGQQFAHVCAILPVEGRCATRADHTGISKLSALKASGPIRQVNVGAASAGGILV